MLNFENKTLESGALNKRALLRPSMAKIGLFKGTLQVMSSEGLRFRIGTAALGVMMALMASWGIATWRLGGIILPPAFLWMPVLGLGIMFGLGLALNNSPGRVHRRPAPGAGDAALLGHEIRNYLCTLKGNAQLLRQRAVNGDQSRILDRMDRVMESLESLAKTLDGNPKTGYSVSPKAHQPLKLGEVSRRCVRTHFSDQSQGFLWSVLEDAGVVRGDPMQFEQVFLNLYANAREAGALTVETRVRQADGRVLVTVEDDGTGCSEQDLPRVFEPFFSTKVGSARRGLGMFIVRSIVECHGGSIRVENKNIRGAGAHGLIFTIELPIANVSDQVSPEPTPAAGLLQGSSRRTQTTPSII